MLNKKANSRGAMMLIMILLLVAGTAAAGTIDLSSGNTFTLAHGQALTLQFSVWNYGLNNPGSSPYPTSVGLQLVGADSNGAIATVPGTNSNYYSGYLLEGELESLDGSASVALQSPTAAQLGITPAALLLTPGIFYGSNGASPVATIEADAAFSLNVSQQIFGTDITSRQSSALIVLQNLGADLVIGVGDGSSLRSAITEPSVTGLGNVQTSGITQALSFASVPEPGTLSTLGVAAIASAGYLFRARLRRLHRRAASANS